MKIKLQVSGPGGQTSLREHAGDQIVVGRDPDCDLSFPDGDTTQGVSWRHAEIQLSPRGALLKDLGSTNGTFLDGARVERPIRLSVGSQIRLGQAGPLLEVAALELADRSPTVAHPVPPPAAAAAAATSSVADQPAGGTRAMLVEMQKQQRTTAWVFAAMGAVALVGLLAVVLFLGRSGQPVVAVKGSGTASSGASESYAAEAAEPAPADAAGAITSAADPVPSGSGTAPAAAPAPPNWKQVVAPYEDALVWLGFRTDSGYRLPYFAGFAVREDRIVTTGFAAKHLLEQIQRGNEAIVSCRALGEEFVTIKEVRIHPRYSEQVNDDEFDFNVAVLTLEKPLPVKPCILAQGDALLSGLKSGTPIATAGYHITEEQLQNAFDPLNPPLIVLLEGTMGGASVPGATTMQSRRALNLAAPDGASGSPIFNNRGQVVAILWVHKANFGVVASTAAELLRDSVQPQGHLR